MTDQELKDWLNQAPSEEVLSTNDDGSKYLDIVLVEDALTFIDAGWGTENFKYRIIDREGIIYGSASVELTIYMFGRYRRIVGAATVRLADDISHSEPTLLSECLKNAAKKLGAATGKYLNDRGMQQEPKISPTKKTPRAKMTGVKMQPDATVMRLYAEAIAEGNQDKVNALLNTYNIKTEKDYAS